MSRLTPRPFPSEAEMRIRVHEKMEAEEQARKQFRFETAKELLISFKPIADSEMIEDRLVDTAVRLTDKLIAKLKEVKQ